MLISAATTTDWFQAFWNQWHVLIRIGGIVIGAILVRWILMFFVARVVRSVESGIAIRNKVVDHIANELSPIARARVVQRTKTMGAVLSSFITWMIVGITAIQVMSEMGVSVGAIIASAGIATAALGFGAQNVVKDVLNGMFMVFEDQFGVGDVVDLGLASGTVENVGVRLTTLRDDEGTVWFVRNGEIQRVGNKSYAVSVKAPILRTPPQAATRAKKPTAS